MTSKKGWLEKNRESEDFRRHYEREEFIEDFLTRAEEELERRGMTRVELAQKMKCSPANITRIMQRTANLTASTMVDLAFALDLRVRASFEPLQTCQSMEVVDVRQVYQPIRSCIFGDETFVQAAMETLRSIREDLDAAAVFFAPIASGPCGPKHGASTSSPKEFDEDPIMSTTPHELAS